MKNLKLFNFGKLLEKASGNSSDNKEACVEFLAGNPQLKLDTPWWCEQALAAIAEHAPVKVDGKYNGKATIASIEDRWLKGLVFYLITQSPSNFHSKAVTKYPQYGSLTPMVMAGYKQYRNIQYEEWDKLSCEKMLPSLLRPLVGLQPLLKVDRGELLQLREELGTGYVHSYYGNKSILKEYPVAARRMLLQNWLCDPNVYQDNGNLIVLDPFNWDYKPEPLISTEVTTKVVDTSDSWY